MNSPLATSGPAILHICLSHGWGGLEMYPIRVGSGLLARGYPVFGLALAGSRVAADMKAAGMQVRELRSSALAPLQLPSLLRWLRQNQIKVLHCHKSRDLLLAALLKSFHPSRLLLTEHMGGKRPKKDWLHRWIYRQVDQVLAISDETLKRNLAALPLPPECITRLWLGTELQRCTEDPTAIRQELGIPAGPVIGIVGRINLRKGQLELLDAFCLLQTEFPDLQLLVVGGKRATEGSDEPCVAQLEQRVAARGLGRVVHLCGFRRDTVRMLQAMDVVAIPSHNEAFGLTVIEAMAAGKAIVGANTGAIPEVLAGVGLTADPHQATELAAQLRKLLRDSQLRTELGQQARRRAEQVFSMNHHLDALLVWYGEPPNG
ncbi:MAG: glycosyltransferase family 4 protein [Aeromonas sp.]